MVTRGPPVRCGWPLSCWGMWRWLVGDVGRMESSVAVAGEDVTPPLGALVAGRAEHVEHLLADLGRLLLEVGAHDSSNALLESCISRTISRFSSSVELSGEYSQSSPLKYAISSAWMSSFNFASSIMVPLSPMSPSAFWHPGLLQIPLQIIPKEAFSFEKKWCADFSNTPLLTCENDYFWGEALTSGLPRFLFPLDRGRRLAGDVVGHAVHAGDLSHDAAGNAGKHLVGELCPVGGHGIAALDGT